MEWKVIKPDVFAAIMDFFSSGLPVVNEDSKPSADTGKDVNKVGRVRHWARNSYSLLFFFSILTVCRPHEPLYKYNRMYLKVLSVTL